MTARWILAAVIGCVASIAHGFDEPYFESVGDATSVPEGSVTALVNDTRGLLWIGTPGGVVRFDGYRFLAYRHDPTAADSLSGNHVQALLGTRDGRVWVATTADGVSIHDPGSDRFRRLRHRDDTPDSLDSDSARALAEEADGTVWIGTIAGLNRLSAGSERVVRQPLWGDDPHGRHAVITIRPAVNGDLWVGTEAGLFRRRHGSADFVRLELESTAPQQVITALGEDRRGRLWIVLRSHGIHVFDPDAPADRRWSAVSDAGALLRSVEVSTLLSPDDDAMWAATAQGIAVIDPRTLQVVRWLRHDPAVRGSLGGLGIRALLRDDSGLIWAGGYGSGLQRHNPGNGAIGVLRHSPSRSDGLSSASVRAVLETADGMWWLGTDDNGIDIVDPERGLIGGFRPGTDPTASLPHSGITALAQTPDGSVWVGTYGNGLLHIDAQTRAIEPVALEPGAAASIFRLLVDRSGVLWVGTRAGLYRLDAERTAIAAFHRVDHTPVREFIAAIAQGPDGMIWAGGRNEGLFVVDPVTAAAVSVQEPADGRGERSHRSVEGLLWDSRQRLWVDTGNGLDRLLEFDGTHARFEQVSARLGIRGTSFGANLLDDADGRIWTQHFVFDPAADAVYELTLADGADYGTGWFRAYTKTRAGLLLFGGSKGVLRIDPQRFRRWSYRPPVVATEFRIDGRVQPLARLSPRLQISAEERGFSVEFAALDFSAPARNRYAYRLEPYDRDWIESESSHRVASYSNLPPGDYTLHVRGSNRVGDFSPRALAIPLTVSPAFWQTVWFNALLVVGLSGAIFSGFRWHTARLRRRADALERLVERRTAELLSSHATLQQSKTELERTHGRLLDTQQQLVMQEKMAALGTLTAGVAHEINNPTNFADGAVQNLDVELQRLHGFLRELAGHDADADVLRAFDQRFARLAEMIGTAREGHERIKRIVRDLRQFTRLDEAEHKEIPIAEPLQSTVNLVRTRFDRIRFVLDLDFNPVIECQPAKLGQVFMNLIVNACEAIEDAAQQRTEGSNAMQPERSEGILRERVNDDEAAQPRTEDGVVSIASNAIPGGVRIVVADNGCGMDEATRARIFEPFFTTKGVGAGTGLGMAIAFGIVKAHGGEIDVESTPRAGTRISVRLPLLQPRERG